MSLATSDGDVVIIKAGWIYRQKTFFRKWKKSWLVVCLGGPVRYYKNKRSDKPQKSFNLKLECMAVKSGRQCHYLLPPNGVESSCLIELIFTGDRTLRLCGQNPEATKDKLLWIKRGFINSPQWPKFSLDHPEKKTNTVTSAGEGMTSASSDADHNLVVKFEILERNFWRRQNHRMWLHAFKRAQSDRELPTPRYERRNWNKEEIEEEEERSCWYCLCRKNKIEKIEPTNDRPNQLSARQAFWT